MSPTSSTRRLETRGRKKTVAFVDRTKVHARLLAYVEEVDLRFAQFLADMRDAGTHSTTTLRWYAQVYECGLRPYLLERPVASREEFRARLFDLSAWERHLRKRVKEISVNNYWRAMRSFYNFMERVDGTPNPYRGAKPPRFNPTPPKAKAQADCERILRAARNYPWATSYARASAVAVLAVMLYAGLRLCEVLALEFDHIDLAGRTIYVERGKGQHGGKPRYVPIAPQLDMLLRLYMRERAARGFVIPEFFVGVRGGPLGKAGVRHIVQCVSAAAGVHFSPHVLRHSFVTTLIMRGVALAVVRDVAGHRDFKTTLGYTAVQTPERLAAVGKLDFLSPPSRIRARH